MAKYEQPCKQPVVDGPNPLWLCTKCEKAKPAADFFPRPRQNKRGLSSQCRECVNAQYRSWHANNREHRLASQRAWREKQKANRTTNQKEQER